MTAERRDGKHETGFSEWTRKVPAIRSSLGYSMMDWDWIHRRDRRDFEDYEHLVAVQKKRGLIAWVWHMYLGHEENFRNRKLNHIMVIEEKIHGAELPLHERDTMCVMSQLMDHYFKVGRGVPVKTARGNTVKAKWWGWHKLRYDGTGPADSERIWWDGRQVTVDQLIGILRFDLHPLSVRTRKFLDPIDHRCHHADRQYRLYGDDPEAA